MGPHHPAAGPHQEDVNLHQAESRGSQHGDPRKSPERREGHEGSVRTTHTTKSHSRGKSHVSHAKHDGNLQREIADLKKELRHARRERSPPCSEPSFEESNGASYKRRSRTLPSETFSYEEEHRHRRKRRSPPSKGLGNDAMNKALSQISKSPFTRNIDDAIHPRRFYQPTFSLYDDHSDPVEHVSYFSQKMAIYSRNETLMCKVFPSSLGPTAMRWFNSLRANSIGSFKTLTRAFGARFITCNRTPRPLGSLLTLSMREGETLKNYSDRYWEMFNEIEGKNDAVAITTFKAGLPTDHDLRKSLTGKPVTSVRQLMDRIDKYRRVEEDQLQGKGKAKDHGHTTDNYRNLWDHLEQLVREGKLKQLLHHSSGRASQAGSEVRGDASSRLPLSTINVIFAAPGRTGSCPARVLSMSRSPTEDHSQALKRAKKRVPLILGFSDEDMVGTIHPHEDALVVTLRIGGYDVRRVMVDQGSAVDVMYPDLYKGLGLNPEDLTTYNSPLVSFEGRLVTPKGLIRLPVQAGTDVVEVDFIVVDVFSPYTAIMGRPWLHTLKAVSSTLHQKVKYPSGDQVLEIVGSQAAARQCLVTAI
ncbi:uncharacterized protein LOC126704236 [Quercus robur]|uniref:uncharacterized protein LOC126704236 n=1 Tax=Quercus robur TaxID=38942 RepID=UPI00216315FC|nr:uncharacterized protein LOC126704236 [Quercus robur]